MSFMPGMRPFPGGRVPLSLLQSLQSLGLTANLKLCLDAGDSSSYSGAGQPWLDTSGNGFDFNRGATSGAEGSDPTFNGTAGGLSASEFMSFDGGDYFRYDSANETWMHNLHKDNAALTAFFWAYGAGTDSLCGTNGNVNTNIGMFLRAATGTGNIQFQVTNGGAGAALSKTTAALGYTASQWNFVGITYDEAAGAGTINCNGTTEAVSGGYTTPSAANATFTMELGARGNAQSLFAAGGRMGGLAMFDAALSAAQLMSIFNETRGRYGI